MGLLLAEGKRKDNAETRRTPSFAEGSRPRLVLRPLRHMRRMKRDPSLRSPRSARDRQDDGISEGLLAALGMTDFRRDFSRYRPRLERRIFGEILRSEDSAQNDGFLYWVSASTGRLLRLDEC